MDRIAQLKSSFMLTGIIGFLISALYISKYSIKLAFAFGIVFFLMIVAAMVSRTRARPDIQLFSKAKKLK